MAHPCSVFFNWYLMSVPFKLTFRGQQSITYIGPHVWNFILSKINPICSIGSYKGHLRVSYKVVITDIWKNEIEKNVILTNTSMYAYAACVYMIVYACMWVYVNVCVHTCTKTCLCTIPYMHVSAVSRCICANDLSFIFSLSLRQTLYCITTDTVLCHCGMVNFRQNLDKR